MSQPRARRPAANQLGSRRPGRSAARQAHFSGAVVAAYIREISGSQRAPRVRGAARQRGTESLAG